MLARLRPRLTFANVVSVMALFVALGGSATAAVVLITGKQVKNGSLTGIDLKNNSVGSVDVKDGDLLAKDFKAGQLPSGLGGAGPKGDTGAQGPKGDAGAQGQQGIQGEAGPLLDVLPSGKTLRGVYDIRGTDRYQDQAVTFQFQLASQTVAHVPAASDTVNCPGTVTEPKALPGHFCVYERLKDSYTGHVVFDPATTDLDKAGKYGADNFISSNLEGTEIRSYGSWAVTAP
jgi:hypothetical protein